MATHVSSGVTVQGVDCFIVGAAQRGAAQETFKQAYCGWGVRSRAVPVAVPDDIDRDRTALKHRAAVVVDAVAGGYRLASWSGVASSVVGEFGHAAVAVGDVLHSIRSTSFARFLRHQKVRGQQDKEQS